MELINRTKNQITLFDYSLNEKWTGKRWLDGKKIYIKTIHTGAIENKNKSVSHGINNIGNMRTLVSSLSYAFVNDSSIPLPLAPTDTKNAMRISINRDVINFQLASNPNVNFADSYVTVMYTCTDR